MPDLGEAVAVYRDRLGAEVGSPLPLPEHGVTVAFVELPNTRIELMEPLGADSPLAAFLQRQPRGGMHHLCYEVDDVAAAASRLAEEGATVLGGGQPRIGAHGRPVVFVAPRDFCGTLIELEEACGA